MATETDSQGRIYLSKDLREKYGEKYHVVEYDGKIELIPIADDPLAAVRKAAGELRDAPTRRSRTPSPTKRRERPVGAPTNDRLRRVRLHDCTGERV